MVDGVPAFIFVAVSFLRDRIEELRGVPSEGARLSAITRRQLYMYERSKANL